MFAVLISITKLHGTSLASHSLLAVLTVGYLKAGINENTVAGGVACAFDLPILHDELAVQRHPLPLALLQHSTSPDIDLGSSYFNRISNITTCWNQYYKKVKIS